MFRKKGQDDGQSSTQANAKDKAVDKVSSSRYWGRWGKQWRQKGQRKRTFYYWLLYLILFGPSGAAKARGKEDGDLVNELISFLQQCL